MIIAGLSPKTIVNYSQVVKLVVASAITEDGEQIYPRKWNHDFIGLPIVERAKQRRPTVTAAELGEILASVKSRYHMLFALLAGTGLRIGEGLAIRVGVAPSKDYSYLTEDCRMVYVNKSIWGGVEQDTKTANAVRVVDIPEPLAQVLRSYVRYREGASAGASQLPASFARYRKESRATCLPSLPFDVAQKERRSKGP
jgi:integrase